MIFLPSEEFWKFYVSNNTTIDDSVKKPIHYPCFAYLKPVGMRGNKEVAYLYLDDLVRMTKQMESFLCLT